MKKIIFVRHGESTENIAIKECKAYDKNKILLTDNGKKQANITGDYLYEVFGKFDIVYSSPAPRCIQTSDIIMKQIKYKKQLYVVDLLVEIGYESSVLDGLSGKERQRIYDDIKLDNLPKDKLFSGIHNWKQFTKKMSETKNPFDKLNIRNVCSDLDFNTIYFNMKPSYHQVLHNLKKFLKELKETEDDTILVITHSGCIDIIQKMLCNVAQLNDEVHFEKSGNCCIMCVGMEKNKYSLISSATIKHL